MKPIIICIVGASGSGKTTASMILRQLLGWNPIVSYTTRPMRDGERNGRDHWFVKKKDVPPKNRMCAYTQFGGYEYWTEWNQFLTLFPNVYVIDEKGLIDLQSKESSPYSFSLFTIKINRNNLSDIDECRKLRDCERVHIPDEFYDYVIDNNGSMEEFRGSLYLAAQCIMQKQ